MRRLLYPLAILAIALCLVSIWNQARAPGGVCLLHVTAQ